MASLKSYFASKRSVAVDQISSSSSEDASDSTRNETPAPSTRNETPAPSTRNETPAPSTSASACPLQCCILDSPTPNRLDVDKETSARLYRKRKRYFQPGWLQKYDWLVLCKTENRAYCQSCRYVLSANLQAEPKNRKHQKR